MNTNISPTYLYSLLATGPVLSVPGNMQPQASSSPDAMKQHIQGPASPPAASSSELRNPHGPASYSSSHSSWSSMRGLSNALGPPKPPLAWASVRHQVVKGVQEVEDIVEEAEQISERLAYSP